MSTLLVPFTGFKLALVRGQTLGTDGTSNAEPLETVKVSFKSDCDNTLEVEDTDDVELVRRRRGWTPNPGGLIPL